MKKIAVVFSAIFVFSSLCVFASNEEEQTLRFGRRVLDDMSRTFNILWANQPNVQQQEMPKMQPLQQAQQNIEELTQPMQVETEQQLQREIPDEVIEQALTQAEAAKLDINTLSQAADNVFSVISGLRELPMPSDIEEGIVSKEEVTSYIIKKLQEDIPDEKIKGEEYLLKKLKLIPQDLSYKDFIISLYTEQVMGYYDYDQKKFYVVEGIPLSILTPVMAHELTHALQDGHFGLKDFTKPMLENSDASFARNALVEGDATYTMMDFTISSAGLKLDEIIDKMPISEQTIEESKKFEKFGQAPQFLQRTLLFPYTDGLNFVSYTIKNYGKAALNSLYSSAPESTEQILHPEKYFVDKDSPSDAKTSDIEALLGPEWQEINSDVFGEFSIYMFIKIFSDEAQAKQASEGWDGDRIKAFQSGNTTAFIWNTVWDSEKDAIEFSNSYINTLNSRYKNIIVPDVEGKTNIYEAQTEEGSIYLNINSSEVLIAEGFEQGVVEKLKNAKFTN